MVTGPGLSVPSRGNVELIFLRLLVLGVAGSFLASACGTPELKISNTPVPALAGKTASFDNIEIDQASHRLYVSDRTDQGVDVFDISAAGAKYMQTIALTSSPNGLAIAPDLARLFVGTAAGSVVVVDILISSPTRYTVTGEVPTGGTSVDLLDYDATQHLVYASNGADGTIRSIDAQTKEIKRDLRTGKSQAFSEVLGGDIVNYNAKVDRFLVASPHTTRPSVVGVFGRNPIAYIASTVTAGNGNSAAYDEAHDVIYTPDTRPGSAGIASFSLSASQTPLSWLPSLSFLAVLLAVVALLFYFVGRSADPVRRREAEPKAEVDRAVRVKAALRSIDR